MLPDERAWSGQQVGEGVGQHGPAGRVAGVSWPGSPGHDSGGRRGPNSTAGATAFDPWPAPPDDAALWSVAGAALDAAQLSRLDREQAGD
ncbi:hypothetical protein ACGFIW_16605 [Micromonospora sp. NPDC048935]|uniref:hypothetical protein n=1 Tax=Micromonospora sp. NPDC048935 TaxID=3364262 RepID=UPI0037102E83